MRKFTPCYVIEITLRGNPRKDSSVVRLQNAFFYKNNFSRIMRLGMAEKKSNGKVEGILNFYY